MSQLDNYSRYDFIGRDFIDKCLFSKLQSLSEKQASKKLVNSLGIFYHRECFRLNFTIFFLVYFLEDDY